MMALFISLLIEDIPQLSIQKERRPIQKILITQDQYNSQHSKIRQNTSDN